MVSYSAVAHPGMRLVLHALQRRYIQPQTTEAPKFKNSRHSNPQSWNLNPTTLNLLNPTTLNLLNPKI